MYTQILIATDGSEDAKIAAEHAVGLARQYETKLHALYVTEVRTAYDNAIVKPEIVHQNLREEGVNALEAIETVARTDVDLRTSIREGIPHEEILNYAIEHEIDLIVMGKTGKSAFKTILLGSATEAVLRSATVPVVVVGSTKATEA